MLNNTQVIWGALHKQTLGMQKVYTGSRANQNPGLDGA